MHEKTAESCIMDSLNQMYSFLCFVKYFYAAGIFNKWLRTLWTSLYVCAHLFTSVWALTIVVVVPPQVPEQGLASWVIMLLLYVPRFSGHLSLIWSHLISIATLIQTEVNLKFNPVLTLNIRVGLNNLNVCEVHSS